MKLRHAILTLAATTMLAMPAAAADEPRGTDRREAQKSNQKSTPRDSARPQRAERRGDARPNRSDARSDRAQRRDQGDRFRDARRTIRHRTVERASERDHQRSTRRVVHNDRRPSAHDLLRERRERQHAVRRPATRDRHDRRRHDDRPRVVVDFRIGSPAYCPPPRQHVVTRTVVIDGPIVQRRRPVVARRPVYVEYTGDAWDDLERGHHRAALDSFGILASSYRDDPLPKIGYGLAAAGLYDDTVAATAFRRALRAEDGALERFRPTPRLTNVLRDLERRYERAARLNPYDSDSVFLLAAVRTMQGEAITQHALDHELQMLSGEDRELLGLTVVIEEGNVGMYDD